MLNEHALRLPESTSSYTMTMIFPTAGFPSSDCTPGLDVNTVRRPAPIPRVSRIRNM